MGSEQRRTIRSAERVFDIVDVLQRRGPLGVSALADELDVTTSTTHQYLATLERVGYVVKEDRSYRLGLRFFERGMQVRNDQAVLDLAQPLLDDLASETGETVWLVVEEGGWAFNLDKRGGDRSSPDFGGRIGDRTYLHTHSAGKAILASLSRERTAEILDRRGLPAMTDATVTDRESLRRELSEIRDRGVAFADGEKVDGVRGVATPVTFDGDVVAALGVSAPENRLRGDWYREEVPDLLVGAANEIQVEYEYRTRSER